MHSIIVEMFGTLDGILIVYSQLQRRNPRNVYKAKEPKIKKYYMSTQLFWRQSTINVSANLLVKQIKFFSLIWFAQVVKDFKAVGCNGFSHSAKKNNYVKESFYELIKLKIQNT